MTTTVAPATTTIAQAIMDSSESWHDTDGGHHASIITWIGVVIFVVYPSLIYFFQEDVSVEKWPKLFCRNKNWFRIPFLLDFFLCRLCLYLFWGASSLGCANWYKDRVEEPYLNRYTRIFKSYDNVPMAAKVMPADEQATVFEAAGTQVQIKKGQKIELETVEGQTITLTTALRM